MDDVELPAGLDGLARRLFVNVEFVGWKSPEKRGQLLSAERNDDIDVAREPRFPVVCRSLGAAHHVLGAQRLEHVNEVAEQLGLIHPAVCARRAAESRRATTRDVRPRSTQ